jgi:hypothetical protein
MPQGFWHLTLCTLLSSQGSGAPTPQPSRGGVRLLSDDTTKTNFYHQVEYLGEVASDVMFKSCYSGLGKSRETLTWLNNLSRLRPFHSDCVSNLWGDKLLDYAEIKGGGKSGEQPGRVELHPAGCPPTEDPKPPPMGAFRKGCATRRRRPQESSCRGGGPPCDRGGCCRQGGRLAQQPSGC